MGLFIVLLILSLCACTQNAPIEGGNEAETTESTVIETAPVTEAEKIMVANLKEYTLVRPEEASQAVVDAAVSLRTMLINSLDSDLALKSDLHSETVQALKIREFEILLGNCDRDETRQFMADLKYNDYGYAMIGNEMLF